MASDVQSSGVLSGGRKVFVGMVILALGCVVMTVGVVKSGQLPSRDIYDFLWKMFAAFCSANALEYWAKAFTKPEAAAVVTTTETNEAPK